MSCQATPTNTSIAAAKQLQTTRCLDLYRKCRIFCHLFISVSAIVWPITMLIITWHQGHQLKDMNYYPIPNVCVPASLNLASPLLSSLLSLPFASTSLFVIAF